MTGLAGVLFTSAPCASPLLHFGPYSAIMIAVIHHSSLERNQYEPSHPFPDRPAAGSGPVSEPAQRLRRPQNQKALDLIPVNRRPVVLKAFADFLQGGELVLLPLGAALNELVFPDVLLHLRDVQLLLYVTDILGDKLLNVGNRLEGHRLFQHSAHLVSVQIPLGEHIGAVLFLGVKQLSPGAIAAFQILPQGGNVHRQIPDQKAALRNRSGEGEIPLLSAAVAPAVKNDADDKGFGVHVIVELAGDVAGKVLSPPGIGVVGVHIGAKVAVQRALRAFIGRLVEVFGICLSEEDNLQGVNDGGFAGSVLSGQKVDVVHLNELLLKVEPVHQKNLLQSLHAPPPFSWRRRFPRGGRWTPPSEWWAAPQIDSRSD